MNTLVLLIDFEGHPVFGDEYTNNLRYSTLIELLNDTQIKKDKILFVSNMMCEKLNDLKEMAIYKDFNWLVVPNNISIMDLIKYIKRNTKFKMDQETTNVIFGGTNTSGCVIGAKSIGIRNFARAGYRCKLYLPMCADYYIKGINSADKMMYSLATVYEKLKNDNLITNTDLIVSKEDLDIQRR